MQTLQDTCDLTPTAAGAAGSTNPTGPLAACVVGSSSYQEAVGVVNAMEMASAAAANAIPATLLTCGQTPTSFSPIRRFLISFLDMVAFIRQQYNNGNLSVATCEGFVDAPGAQPGTCQCILAQLCVRFLNVAFPSTPPLPPSTALAYLLMAVLNHAPEPTSTDVLEPSAGAPELINNVLLMANVMQTPIDWGVLTNGACGFDATDVCTLLTYATPGLLQSSMASFSLCGTSGVPFTLASMTSIPDRFIDGTRGCAIGCGEWLSEFQKDADNCQDYVQSLFNYSSPPKVASNICQANGIFFGGSPGAAQSTCEKMFSTSLSTLMDTALACCKSSRSAARQKGLRWFLLGLGIVCAIVLIVGVAGLFNKLSVLSKKNAINTVYAAKAAAGASHS